MNLYVKNIYLTYFSIKTFNINLCTTEILTSIISCETVHGERKSNMYDSHFAILNAPIRAYTTFSNSALIRHLRIKTVTDTAIELRLKSS